jgi:tetratricopeptide (TPR) repeat protein
MGASVTIAWIVAGIAGLIWVIGYFGALRFSRSKWEGERDGKAMADLVATTENGIRDAMRRHPNSVKPAQEWVKLSLAAGDLPEAIRRAEIFVGMFPSRAEPIASLAEVLARSGRVAESDALLEKNMVRFRSSPWLHVAYAENSRRRRDGPETERRARPLVEKFPKLINTYVIGIWALTAQHKYDEAEALIKKGEKAIGKELGHFGKIPAAEIASARGDWRAAAPLWMEIRMSYPSHAQAYSGGSQAFRELGDLESAKDMIEAGVKRFPDDEAIRLEYGRVMAALPSSAERVDAGAIV